MEILADLRTQILQYYDQIIVLIPKLAIGLVVTAIFIVIMRFIRKNVHKILKSKADDYLLVNFINKIFRITNFLLGTLILLYIIGMGKVAASALGLASVSAIVVGFAFKDIGENFLAGIIMAFKRPFRINDTIRSNEVEGTIVRMNIRDTQIKTFDGKDVYVPNAQIIKNPLYNYTIDGFLRGNFIIGIDYGSDVEQARTLILDTINQVPGVLQEEKPPRTHVKNLNTSTVDIEVHYWIDTFNKDYSSLEIKSQAQTKIINALIKADIGLPADIIEVKNYDDKLKMHNPTKKTA